MMQIDFPQRLDCRLDVLEFGTILWEPSLSNLGVCVCVFATILSSSCTSAHRWRIALATPASMAGLSGPCELEAGAPPSARIGFITCIGGDNGGDVSDLAIGVVSMVLFVSTTTGTWVATDETTSYEVSAETSQTGP